MTVRQVYSGVVVIEEEPDAVPVEVWTMDNPVGPLGVIGAGGVALFRIDSPTVDIVDNRLTITGTRSDTLAPVTLRAATPRTVTGVYNRFAASTPDGTEIQRTGTVTQDDQAITLRANNGTTHVYPGASLQPMASGYTLYPWNYPTASAVILTVARGCGCRG